MDPSGSTPSTGCGLLPWQILDLEALTRSCADSALGLGAVAEQSRLPPLVRVWVGERPAAWVVHGSEGLAPLLRLTTETGGESRQSLL